MPPTLVRNATRRSGITAEAGYNCVELTGAPGPSGFPWMRNRLVDGQTGAGSSQPNERSDGQLGGFPLNADRWCSWVERFPEQLPTTTQDRWQVIGPEIHGPTVAPFDQALLMMEVSPSKRRRLNANAGRPATRYFDLGAIVAGEEVEWLLHVRLSAGADGLIELWKNKATTPIVRITGPTIFQATAGSYWKEANYRSASINGPMTHDFTGLRIYDGDPREGGEIPPPPPSADTTAPTIAVTLPIAGASYPLEAVPYDFTIADADPAVKAWVGKGGPGATSKAFTGPGRYIGTLDLKAAGNAAGGAGLYIDAVDTAGNRAPVWTANIVTTDGTVPPVDPCTTVRERLVAAEARAILAETTLAAVRSGVATETQRHGAAIATALGGPTA